MKENFQCSGRFRDLSALSKTPTPWTHIAPRGEFPGSVEIPAGYDVPGYGVAKENMTVEGFTIFNDQTLESMVNQFRGEILIDADHLSHDQEQTTEAMGWGRKLRHLPNRDGLELETEWTPPGREKITTQVYRYISPEFAGAVRFESGVFKFYPSELAGAGLTNRPKLKVLRPVSANRNKSGHTGTKRSALLCRILGVQETATDEEIETKTTEFLAEVATCKNRAAVADRLEKEISEQAINSDLERFADVIADKESAKLLLQTNRDAVVQLFTAAQAKKATGGDNGIIPPLYQKNRATAPDGKKFFESGNDRSAEQRSLVATIQNREKCAFSAAWNIAKAERPELF